MWWVEAHDRLGRMDDKKMWKNRREKKRKSEQSRKEPMQQPSHLINTTTNEAGPQSTPPELSKPRP